MSAIPAEDLREANEAMDDLYAARVAARERAVEAARAIERELRIVLDGEPLRGAPNLMPPPAAGALALPPFRGFQVRGGDVGARVLPGGRRPGRSSSTGRYLVLTDRGVLRLVSVFPDGRTIALADPYEEGPDAFRAEDLRDLADRATDALRDHVARVRRTTEAFRAASELADRLAAALGVRRDG